MSSTDEKRLRRFYRDHLVPVAERLRARGVSLFPVGPEPEADTWYRPGPSGEAEFVEIEIDDCERLIRELWEARGLPEIAELAGPLMELSRELEQTEEQSSEVSPFVYVMY